MQSTGEARHRAHGRSRFCAEMPASAVAILGGMLAHLDLDAFFAAVEV
jgi:hypothetical protein